MTATFCLTLPFPPSVNNLFANVGRRRVETARYTAWRKACATEIMVQRVRPIAGRVNVSIDLVAPDRRRRDLDNCLKAPLDALVKAGLIDDDSDVHRIFAGWEETGAPCTVRVSAVERVLP